MQLFKLRNIACAFALLFCIHTLQAGGGVWVANVSYVEGGVSKKGYITIGYLTEEETTVLMNQEDKFRLYLNTLAEADSRIRLYHEIYSYSQVDNQGFYFLDESGEEVKLNAIKELKLLQVLAKNEGVSVQTKLSKEDLSWVSNVNKVPKKLKHLQTQDEPGCHLIAFCHGDHLKIAQSLFDELCSLPSQDLKRKQTLLDALRRYQVVVLEQCLC